MQPTFLFGHLTQNDAFIQIPNPLLLLQAKLSEPHTFPSDPFQGRRSRSLTKHYSCLSGSYGLIIYNYIIIIHNPNYTVLLTCAKYWAYSVAVTMSLSSSVNVSEANWAMPPSDTTFMSLLRMVAISPFFSSCFNWTKDFTTINLLRRSPNPR